MPPFSYSRKSKFATVTMSIVRKVYTFLAIPFIGGAPMSSDDDDDIEVLSRHPDAQQRRGPRSRSPQEWYGRPDGGRRRRPRGLRHNHGGGPGR
jgi:hypothetical protein